MFMMSAVGILIHVHHHHLQVLSEDCTIKVGHYKLSERLSVSACTIHWNNRVKNSFIFCVGVFRCLLVIDRAPDTSVHVGWSHSPTVCAVLVADLHELADLCGSRQFYGRRSATCRPLGAWPRRRPRSSADLARRRRSHFHCSGKTKSKEAHRSKDPKDQLLPIVSSSSQSFPLLCGNYESNSFEQKVHYASSQFLPTAFSFALERTDSSSTDTSDLKERCWSINFPYQW